MILFQDHNTMKSAKNNLFLRQNRIEQSRESQKGATLLLAILVLAAITSIVFSIASIVINEIKTSGDVAKAEPVISADEALAEDELFKVMRGLGAVATCANPSTTVINSVQV